MFLGPFNYSRTHQQRLCLLGIDLQPPRIYAVAGAPGAGKTSFVKQQIHARTFPDTAFIHDCDATMESMSGYQNDLIKLGSQLAFAKWELPSRHIAEEQLLQAVQNKNDIIYDRSCALLSSHEFLKEIVTLHGYQLFFYYLEVDLEVALRRSKARELVTGRHIPPLEIESRMKNLKILIPQYQNLASKMYTIPNNLPQKDLK